VVTVATSPPHEAVWQVGDTVSLDLEADQSELVFALESSNANFQSASSMRVQVRRATADPESPGPEGWGIQLEGGDPASQELVWGQGSYGTPIAEIQWDQDLACAEGIERCERTFTLWRPEDQQVQVPLTIQVHLHNPAIEEVSDHDATLRVIP
jgi:hypothetical protein